jgi:hypothetical protein
MLLNTRASPPASRTPSTRSAYFLRLATLLMRNSLSVCVWWGGGGRGRKSSQRRAGGVVSVGEHVHADKVGLLGPKVFPLGLILGKATNC